MNWQKNLTLVVLFIILIGSFAVRLYKINNPIADWHSWRQADTAAVARNFLKFGIDPLQPRYDDLSNVQTGRDNPMGWRMVEFPLYQMMGVGLYKIFPMVSIEIALRLVSIIFSLFSILLLYLLVKKYYGEFIALATITFFGFLPYSVYYSRTILPEITGVGFALGAIYFADKAKGGIKELTNSRINEHSFLILSSILAAASLLVKPTTGFLLLPIAYIFLKKYRLRVFTNLSVYIYALISFAPLYLWRIWINNYPEGIPAYTWLLNGGNIRFTGAFFRWILAERLGKLILGYTGFFLILSGLISKSIKKTWLFATLLLGTILYVVIFAKGNVQHDYYQILTIPIICILCGKGLAFVLRSKSVTENKLAGYSVTLFVLLSMFAFSWYETRGYYWINHPEIVEAGMMVDALTPKDAKIIAPYNGDTAFLYQTNRQGWPVVQKPIPEMVKMGAEFLVIVNPDNDALNLQKIYKILVRKEKYVIYDIRNPS